jgi:hypothetical protein
MADVMLSPERNGIRYGLMTAAGMIAYFLIAALFGVAHRVEFSSLNLVILIIGICMAIAHYKNVRNDRMPYLHGMGTGIITAAVASGTMGLFLMIYMFINPSFSEQLGVADYFGFDFSVPAIAFLGVLMQGAMGGVIISLVAMQYFKSPDHKPIEQMGLE